MQINLRDDLQQRVAARVAEGHYKNVDEYFEALVSADFDESEADDDIEEILLQRLDSGPAIELTPEFEKQFLAEMAQRDKSAGR